MKYHAAFSTALAVLLASPNGTAAEPTHHEADVCVYGGTASGVMAALAAKKEGASVVLVEPSRWLGGMTGGGINHLDWGKGSTVGGSTYKILMEGLEVKEQKHHGGHAIEGIGNRQYRERFKKLVEDAGITVIYEHRLGKVQVGDATIDKPTRQKPIPMDATFEEKEEGSSIQSITLDHAPFDKTGCPIPEPNKRNAITVSAKVFIDCSYEGDVLAMSGASYTWGRESREKYGESLAGVRPNLWLHDIDPYIEPGNPESGVLPFVQDDKMGPLGSADDLTMGYCFRFELDMSGKGIPVPEPANYDPAEFEVYRRAIRDGVDIFSNKHMRTTLKNVSVHKRKPFVGGAQLNRNVMASTVHGINDNYPNGDWATRSRIWKFHQEFLCKSIHFAKTDPTAPESMKRSAMKTTFRKGVFDETGGWPHQLYIRQARRMVSSYVVSQKDIEGKTDPPHTVGLAAYGVDDFPYTTVAQDGKIAVQGGGLSIIYLDGGKYNGSYKIPYESIVPRKGECDNLIVPVCVSASHIAFTSLRMEPVWMVLGESAGVAATMALAAKIPVQDVPYPELRKKLDALGQTLDRIPPQDPKAPKAPKPQASWKSQAEWNRQKKGYEWLFPHIDTNSDGKISADEYKAF
ncbi:MAG: FAD-dependent oxidoreductase, partial [Luteolibacter sp.]